VSAGTPAAICDAVVPFMFESLPVRGALIQLQKSWQRMQRDHDYAPPVRSVLGEAAAATGLIAQSLKFDGAVTLQISGDGLLNMLVMQCTNELGMRGMAAAADDIGNPSFADLASESRCAVIVDSGNMEQPYQGIVEIRPESLAVSLEGYFERSVQLASRIVLIAEENLSAGILLQQMPDRGATVEDDWHRLGLLAATLRANDFAEGVGLSLIHKLFNEDDVRVYDPRGVVFQCRCSRSRAEEVLRLLGAEDALAACEERGRVDVSCEYCGRRESFDPVDVSRLFAGPSMQGPGTLQ